MATKTWIDTIKVSPGDYTKDKHLAVPINFSTRRILKKVGLIKTPFVQEKEWKVISDNLSYEVIQYLKENAGHKIKVREESKLIQKKVQDAVLKVLSSGGIPNTMLVSDSETKKMVSKYTVGETKVYVDDDLIDEVLIFDNNYLSVYRYGKTKYDQTNYGICSTMKNTAAWVEFQ